MPRHPRRRRWPWVVGGATVALLVILGIVGATSGTQDKKATIGQTATTLATDTIPPVVAPSDNPSDTPEPIGPLRPAEYQDFSTDAGADFKLAVGTALGTANAAGSYWAGYAVTVAGDLTGLTIDSSDFSLSPVAAGLDGAASGQDNPDLVGSADNISPIACGSTPPLADALASADGKTRVTGCLLFSYDPTDHPTLITYTPNGDPTKTAVQWQAVNSAHPLAPETGIVYTVTSDGGINDVTYSVGGFDQEQDTDVSGNTWTKRIPDDGVSIATLLAQSNGSGTISCTIKVDGQVVARQSSHGAYAVVTCTADL